jgi:hypothetical protein
MESIKMSRRKHHKKPKERNQIARTTRSWLILLISFLSAIALLFIFKVGVGQWAHWMVEYRSAIIGIILFIVVVLIASSPVIIEVNSNSRPLSGPGHNPKEGWKK